MPIAASDSPSPDDRDAALRAIHQHALVLRSQGRNDEAAAVYREAIAKFPDEPALHNNLAVLLSERGELEQALNEYRELVRRHPSFWQALYGAAMLLMRRNSFIEAEEFFRRALEYRHNFVPAHLALYELAQLRADREQALLHQARALGEQQLFSEYAQGISERKVLALMAPGDWQANVPVDFLFDRVTTTLHKLYLFDRKQLLNLSLPAYHVVFNAMAESDDAILPLALAEEFIAMQDRPFINAPKNVERTNRVQLARLLADARCTIPPTMRLARVELENAALPMDFPFIIRPVGSHAGHGLGRVADAQELQRYLVASDASEFYVTPFVDYRSGDGYYRKYRIILVDGEPLPVHMAISRHWMVHYYNAPMAEHAWMRAEEERFLADFHGFGSEQQEALREIAQRLELEYFGVDCALDASGRVLIFEADPGVIVHLSDPQELYPYKHQYVPRIFRAVERMIDKRIARSQ